MSPEHRVRSGTALGRGYFALQALAGVVWWLGVFWSPTVRLITLGELDPVLVAAFDLPLFVGASVIAALGSRAAAWIATGWTVVVSIGMAVYATLTTDAGWGALIMLGAAGASVVALCLLLTGRVPTHWLAIGPFRFRPVAAARPTSANLRDTGLQTLLFWTCFLGLFPAVISVLERRWRLAIEMPEVVWPIGLLLLLTATALGVWSAVTMSTRGGGTPLPSAMPNRLVITGPYRRVRNPMAVAGIVQGIGVGLMLSSWLVIGYALLGSLIWHLAVRPLEEADLEARFGDDFVRYRRTVRCWLPRVRVASVRA